MYEQLHPHVLDVLSIPTSELPPVHQSRIHIFSSVVATFFAPSDPCGISGMHHERIHATPLWHGDCPHYDCVYVTTGPEHGMCGMHSACVRLLFSFVYQQLIYNCAFVEWFVRSDNHPDPETGMWVVEPEFDNNGHISSLVIDVDTIIRSAHLIPVFGNITLPSTFHFSDSLDTFSAYYVNQFADHHTFELVV